MTEDFYKTSGGKYAAFAKQYLEGALVLDRAQRKRGKILVLPTLGLAGHGLELMLKACTFWNGEKPITTGNGGHAIIGMWESTVCEPVRGHLFANATRLAAYERESKTFPDVPADEDVLTVVDDLVRALGTLHGMKKIYPLRYPSDPNTMRPNTPFLVQSLWSTADDFVKRPRDFKLDAFLGRI